MDLKHPLSIRYLMDAFRILFLSYLQFYEIRKHVCINIWNNQIIHAKHANSQVEDPQESMLADNHFQMQLLEAPEPAS